MAVPAPLAALGVLGLLFGIEARRGFGDARLSDAQHRVMWCFSHPADMQKAGIGGGNCRDTGRKVAQGEAERRDLGNANLQEQTGVYRWSY